MRCLHSQARTDIELCIKCTNSFQVYGTERCLPRSLTQETCSVSSRIALPRLPRVEEGPHHRVAQIWGRADQLATLLSRFLGSTKSSVNFYFLVIQTTDGPHSQQILPPTTQIARAFLCWYGFDAGVLCRTHLRQRLDFRNLPAPSAISLLYVK